MNVPTQAINWIVDQLHVGTPDSEIEADIRDRANPDKGWTPALTDAAVKQAIKRHAENRDLFNRVNSGRI